MLVSGSTVSELPVSSSKDMLNKYNDEIIRVNLNINEQDSDIVLNIKSLSKINKPLIWTMRDMWAFTGGSHYEMDFEKYEKSSISTFMKNYKKKSYKGNFQFVAVSDWLKKKAKKSVVLNEHNIFHEI